MSLLNYCLLGFVVFAIFDVWLYASSSYPIRTSSFLYKLPGGGFVAFYKSRRR